MRITFDRITYEETSITSACIADMQELRHLIGGDITITFGERSAVYDEACVSDFGVTLAESFAGYFASPKPRISFFSPDFYGVYTMRIAGEAGERCEVYLGDELICDGMSLFAILEGARHFISQVRPLLKERYGHIEHLWDIYLVPVF